MRILVLTNLYPPHHYGGYELSCYDTVEHWRAAGHDVLVLTGDPRRSGIDDPPGERAHVRRDLKLYWDNHRIVRPSIRGRIDMERTNQRVLKRALADFRPDVASGWHMGGMSLGLLRTLQERDVPIALVVSDDWMLYAHRLDAWTRLSLRVPALAAVGRRVTGLPFGPRKLPGVPVCFISDFTRRRAQARSPSPPEISTVVYSGIHSHLFAACDTPSDGWRWRLAYVGRLEDRKGVHTAVRAFAELPAETTLDIDGHGDEAYARRLLELATELGVADRVRFHASPRDELPRRYKAADVLVFPVEWDEPFGLVPIEAMACGTPVVATGTGGSGEFLVHEGNCLLFPPGDAAALAASVRRLASDADLRGQLVAAGRATADELGVDRLAQVLERWHVAAATRFADGVPEDRPTIAERLRPAGRATPPDSAG